MVAWAWVVARLRRRPQEHRRAGSEGVRPALAQDERSRSSARAAEGPLMHCGPRYENRQWFTIYVIEGPRGALYVGSTTDLDERLREHRASGRYRRLRRDMMPQTRCSTRARAEALEARTARKLRARGLDVEQS